MEEIRNKTIELAQIVMIIIICRGSSSFTYLRSAINARTAATTAEMIVNVSGLKTRRTIIVKVGLIRFICIMQDAGMLHAMEIR